MGRFEAPWAPALKVSPGFFLLLMVGISGGLLAVGVRLSPDPSAFLGDLGARLGP